YPFHIKFEKNVPFPLKTYGPYIYPEGDYEAILITLGEGNGENWWCVLFPPLCFVDFFSNTKVADADEDIHDDHEYEDDIESSIQENEEEDVEVRFFLFDLFNFS